jgi:ABC-type molybdate transport system substrate-binding protein
MLRRMLRRIAMSVSLLVTFLLPILKARTADLKVMGASPVENTFKELIPAFARETGHKVEGVFNTVGFIQERLTAGERPDILILSAPVMEAMEKAGSVVPGTRVEIGRTYVGAISSESLNGDAARALLAMLTSPAAREKFKEAGL